MHAIIFLLIALLALPAQADTTDAGSVDVKVEIDGEVVRVDAAFSVAATREQAWAVLTDFDHLADFISNLKSSSIVAKSADSVTVAQKGKASAGPLSFSFESVREIRMTPMEEIRSHVISGNMKRFDGVTRLLPEAAGMRILFHSEAIPNAWIPPLIGRRFIASETREQLQEMRAEILRRKLAAADK